jgi:hypothetical protein
MAGRSASASPEYFEAAERRAASVEQLGEEKPGDADRDRTVTIPEASLRERLENSPRAIADNEPKTRSVTSVQK